ncbi:hypothetical protein CFC21_005692 [Triticum aestivum]|uniref:Phosphoglycerate kinase n=3 Tax=Triticum TaxID=4564 RepID=A0A9R0QMC2_TRITD|nr:phosphoglycerate kinase, cytosolic-like [Triticum dicoccoides]XP_044366050.1 phosphoglycerate kinase, cytosolic-like [Triticum aestivum]KAF6988112.1 hypothetical protein CFC21_005692 [Triticum aestivum]VAH14158.1 unnamed protein product [Triticum turgidum subsp. durum]
MLYMGIGVVDGGGSSSSSTPLLLLQQYARLRVAHPSWQLTVQRQVAKIVPATAIPDGWMGLDVGPDCIKTFAEALDTAKTVIWNGPMGVFEFEKFSAGTDAIAKQLAELTGKGVTTIIGGGDSVAAVEKAGLADNMSHI